MAPADIGMCQYRLEEEKGLRIRFTTGLVPDEYRDEIAEEESKYGEFLRIPIKVSPLSHLTVQRAGPLPRARGEHTLALCCLIENALTTVQDSAVTPAQMPVPLAREVSGLCLQRSASAMPGANCTYLRRLRADSSPSSKHRITSMRCSTR